jgi:hypothetical protein
MNGLPLPGRGSESETHTLAVLQKANYFEEVVCAWISAGAEHSHEALGRDLRSLRELGKAHGRVDVIAQYSLGRGNSSQ